MRKLTVFKLITLDGYFAGQGGDISWHNVDAEFNGYAEESSNAGNTLLFGRVTYELMAGYRPTQEALKNDPKNSIGDWGFMADFADPEGNVMALWEKSEQ